jgi:hypothetical protein
MRVVISFDEMKPHWAVQRGLDKEAQRLGMKDVKIGGDFDAKITHIYGTVEDFAIFESAFQFSRLVEGSLSQVQSEGHE